MKISGLTVFKIMCSLFVAFVMLGSMYYIVFEAGTSSMVTRILGGALVVMFCPFMIFLLWKDLTRA